MFIIRENDIGFVVRKLSNLIKRDVEKSRIKLGFEDIKGINGWAIAYFYENRDKDVFQKDFETKFSIRRSTASVILKTMEQKGLIERIGVKSDARLKKIVLTEKAVDIHKKITKEIEEREARLRKNVTEEELKVFFNCITKFCANMEDQND
ncbi:MAG: MarR family transcriptional regulator [Clostridia bacterium]|nr:MarR family transcriptional regulator [Clostridia bacterium]MBR4972869.1 MarR family transcriptional regulator [Clostridia bacterium]